MFAHNRIRCMLLELDGTGGDGAAAQLRRMRDAGLEVPGILYLLAQNPEWTAALNTLAQRVMRGPGALPPWQRELLAALTSRCNSCVF